MAADIFAPPSKEELQLFAPPTEAELHGTAPKAPEIAPSQLESGLRGVGQGASLGFADELAGVGSAGLQALRKMTPSDAVRDYLTARNEYRARDEAAKKANPKTFTAGELGGGVGTMFIPGLNVAKGATLGARALGAAKLGALAGVGTANELEDVPNQAVLGGATGAVLGPAAERIISPAVGYGARKLGALAGSVGKKALNVVTDVPEVVSSRYLANPDAVNNALPREQVAQKIADTLGEVRGKTGSLNEKAVGALSKQRTPKPGFEVNHALGYLDKFEDPDASKLAAKLREEYQLRSGGLSPEAHSNYLTENEVHDVKKTLQGLTDWKKPLPTAEQAKARSAAGQLNQTLRESNPEYASGMSDLAANINTKEGLANKFGIKPDFTRDSGFAPTDRTMSAMQDIIKAKKIDRKQILGALNEQGHGDLSDDIQNTIAKEALQSGYTNGSRKAVMGGTVGGAVGYKFGGAPGALVGGAIGSHVGGTLDKYGGPVAKSALDATLLAQKLAKSPTAQKFGGAIKKAASRGQAALSATHYILSQTQPEYQAAMKDE